MAAQNALAVERLARVMAVRHRQFAARVVVAAVVSGLFFGFTGWAFATVWFSAYVVLQVLELKLYGADATKALRSPFRYRATLYLLSLNTLLLCAFGMAEAVSGGAWGVTCGCLLWAGSIMNSVVVSNGSKDAFAYQAAPAAVFYLMAPIFTLTAGAPWIDTGALTMAGLLNVMIGVTVWGASQKLFEAEQTARAELDRKRIEAEAATAAKSAFVAMVSHELRTPISAIMAGASDIEQGALENNVRSSALLIGDSARMMRTLLNDLLDLSKLEAKRMSVEVIGYDLRSLALDAVRFWSTEVHKKGLRMRLEGAAHLPQWVMGDPTRLRQILNNLFSNAVKFTNAGSITLKIASSLGEDGDHWVEFSVIDTGPGMSPAQVGRLFTAFEQLGASTARTHGGTGLGLAISRDLAQLMGGTLTAESREGEGSTFRLVLPLAPGVAPQAGVEPARVVEASGERSLRVLIADDHEFNRRAFTLMLEAAAAEVATAATGRQALEALDARRFDVVLMDVNMPEMDGIEAVQRLRRSSSQSADVPIIALTAAGGADDIQACIDAGMDGFVTKPVDAAELFAAIDQALALAPRAFRAAMSA